VDGAAHRGALQAGGRTLAVLAGGLSRIYPPEHKGLADEVEKAGALLTESCMKQEPLASLFPARNRIISGLCRAVVLVEAAEKSGALITATHAAVAGRNAAACLGLLGRRAASSRRDGAATGYRRGASVRDAAHDGDEERRAPITRQSLRASVNPGPTSAIVSAGRGEKLATDE